MFRLNFIPSLGFCNYFRHGWHVSKLSQRINLGMNSLCSCRYVSVYIAFLFKVQRWRSTSQLTHSSYSTNRKSEKMWQLPSRWSSIMLMPKPVLAIPNWQKQTSLTIQSFVLFCSHQVFWPPHLTGPLKLERLVWGGDPIPMPAGIGFSFRIGRGGSLTCMWVVQTHRKLLLF